MIGLVYFSDDPDKKVFRRVYPLPSDNISAVLDSTEWVTLGIPSSRTAVLVRVSDDSSQALASMTGTPMSPPTDSISISTVA